MKTNRFLLFAGEGYYPLAGWSSFIDSYKTLELAMRAVEQENERQYVVNGEDCQWFEIVDLEEGKPVLQGGEPYGGLYGSEQWKQRKEWQEWEKENDREEI